MPNTVHFLSFSVIEHSVVLTYILIMWYISNLGVCLSLGTFWVLYILKCLWLNVQSLLCWSWHLQLLLFCGCNHFKYLPCTSSLHHVSLLCSVLSFPYSLLDWENLSVNMQWKFFPVWENYQRSLQNLAQQHHVMRKQKKVRRWCFITCLLPRFYVLAVSKG